MNLNDFIHMIHFLLTLTLLVFFLSLAGYVKKTFPMAQISPLQSVKKISTYKV